MWGICTTTGCIKPSFRSVKRVWCCSLQNGPNLVQSVNTLICAWNLDLTNFQMHRKWCKKKKRIFFLHSVWLQMIPRWTSLGKNWNNINSLPRPWQVHFLNPVTTTRLKDNSSAAANWLSQLGAVCQSTNPPLTLWWPGFPDWWTKPHAELLKCEYLWHIGYQVGALSTPYMGIRSGGHGVQALDWMKRIGDLVL